MKNPAQRFPQGDQRYRVHKSIKCYVGELDGFTWYFHDSIERVIRVFPDGSRRVLYKNAFYEILPARRMRKLINTHTKFGGGVNVGGVHISSSDVVHRYDSFPFIDTRTEEEAKAYLRLLSRLSEEKKREAERRAA